MRSHWFFKVEEGEEIKKLAEEKGKIVCVTYGFSGFDLLSQMRSMVLNGDIGEVTMVDLRYAHGFACDPTGDKQAEGQKWRVDPGQSPARPLYLATCPPTPSICPS